MPIICGAIAIEAALTQLFMKWKEVEHGFPATSVRESDRAKWAKEYRKGIDRGGFSGEANFVSRYLTTKTFDAFVSGCFKSKTNAERNKSGINVPESQLNSAHIHGALFDKRNRIMHWGKADYE